MRACLILLLFLLGCSFRERPLQFNLVAETVQFDWNRVIDAPSVVVVDNLMEGLTTYGNTLSAATPELLRPIPALASSWTVLNQGKTYRFRIRKNVFWTDGTRLSAQHFVDSWLRVLSPATRSDAAYLLFVIEGAREFNLGKRKAKDVGIRVLDDDVLEVDLRKPVPYFLHLVATANMFPIRKDLIEKHGKNWTLPENLVTIGPYRLGGFNPGAQLELLRNADYWGERPAIKRVVAKMVAEPITALALYENGEIDILPRELPSQFLDKIQGRGDFRSGPKLSVFYLVFNTKKGFFRNVKHRRVVAQALNREVLSQYFRGAMSPLNTLVPPGLPGYSSTKIGEIEKTGSFAGSSVDLWYAGSDTWNLMMQSLQKQVGDNTGLRVRVNRMEWKEYNQKLTTGLRPDILHIGWGADYPDPDSFLSVFTRGNDANYSGWTSREYDHLVERAAATDNEAEREALYRDAQKILIDEEAVVVPLFYSSHMALVRSELKGVVLNPLDKWYFKNYRWQK